MASSLIDAWTAAIDRGATRVANVLRSALPRESIVSAAASMEVVKYIPDLSGMSYVQVVGPDVLRWSVHLVGRGGGPTQVRIGGAQGFSQDWLIQDNQHVKFTFADYGPMIQQPWSFRNGGGVDSVVMYVTRVVSA